MSVSKVGFGALVLLLALVAQPAAGQLPCVGDCDQDGTVAINELIRGVNISLGFLDVLECPSFDSNGDGEVAINELIQAVNAALQGCSLFTATPTGSPAGATDTPDPGTPTATPEITDTPDPGTPTATPCDAQCLPGEVLDPETCLCITVSTATPTVANPTDTPTDTPEPTATSTATMPAPTSTPDGTGEQVAGASAAVANSLSSIVNVVGAVVAGASGDFAGAVVNSLFEGGGAGPDIDPCELGGTVSTSITIQGLSANVSVVFSMCAVSRPGGSVLFDGALNVNNLGLNFRGQGAFDAMIIFRNEQGVATAVTDADIASPVLLRLGPANGDPCAVELPVLGERLVVGIGLDNLTGTLSSSVPDQGAAQVEFLGTAVDLTIIGSDEDCVPTEFDLSFDGDSEITQTVDGAPLSFALEFVDFLMSAMQSGNASLVSMSGDLVASCFNGQVTLSTPESLSFLLGQFCPGSGTIAIQDIGEIIYSDSGVSVGGMTFASCLDEALLTCAE